MKTPIKTFLLILNLFCFFLALYWLYKNSDFEPALAAISFFINCVTLVWGDTVYEKISLKKIHNNSDIDIDSSGKEVRLEMEDVDSSKIKYKK